MTTLPQHGRICFSWEHLMGYVMPMQLVFKSSHRLFAADCRLEKLHVVSTGPLAKHLNIVTEVKNFIYGICFYSGKPVRVLK